MDFSRELEVKLLKHMGDMLRRVDDPLHGVNPNHFREGSLPAWERSREAKGNFPANIRAIPLKIKPLEQLNAGVAKITDHSDTAYLTIEHVARDTEGQSGDWEKAAKQKLGPLLEEIAANAGLSIAKATPRGVVGKDELRVSGIRRVYESDTGITTTETRATFRDDAQTREALAAGIEKALQSRKAPRSPADIMVEQQRGTLSAGRGRN
jgi:hypothetical protein